MHFAKGGSARLQPSITSGCGGGLCPQIRTPTFMSPKTKCTTAPHFRWRPTAIFPIGFRTVVSVQHGEKRWRKLSISMTLMWSILTAVP